ncbi:hypothetical protein Areg01_81200 [Actinoplanes regularis]|nr:hypothetical protein Areg01_81200 [Actinoplanes regularis]
MVVIEPDARFGYPARFVSKPSDLRLRERRGRFVSNYRLARDDKYRSGSALKLRKFAELAASRPPEFRAPLSKEG